jgi:tetratricopeptide (TPR) repeat protein
MAMLHVQARQLDEAEKHAKRAVQIDGSARSWRGLANVYLAAGRHQDAERALREGLSRHDDPEAHLVLGNVKVQRGDHAGALEQLAKAWVGDPRDLRAIQQVIHMYRDSAWMLGVAVLARITRAGSHAPEMQVMLDLIMLEMVRVLEQSPLKDMMGIGEEAAKGLRESVPKVPAAAQLRAARTLVETERTAEALAIVDRVVAGGASGRDLGDALYIRAFVRGASGDLKGAIATYRKAVEAYPEHWEAATNAINLCLRLGDAAALAEAGWFVQQVPRVIRRLNPFMTYNEAAWHAHAGRDAEAQELLAFLRESPPGQLEGAIGVLEKNLAQRQKLN